MKLLATQNSDFIVIRNIVSISSPYEDLLYNRYKDIEKSSVTSLGWTFKITCIGGKVFTYFGYKDEAEARDAFTKILKFIEDGL